jgi:amino acid permease
MKAICYLLGFVCIIIAVVYFVMPADQLPSFMPGHQAGVMRVHMKHGALAGGIGVVLFIIGWVMGRRG